jgi:hypothetical protein
MNPSFRRHGDAIRMELDDGEVALLRELHEQLRRWLADPDPADPVMARLFPPCAPEDDLVDAEVRALIFEDLLAERIAGLDEVIAIIDRGRARSGRVRVDLDEDEPSLLLGVLNDIRLALGARIGITTLDRNEVDEDHPAAWGLLVMDHLAFLQEQLIRLLDPAAASDEW